MKACVPNELLVELHFFGTVVNEKSSDMLLHTTWNALVMYSAWNTKDNYDMSASVFVVQLNGFMSLTSDCDVTYSY